MRTIPFLMAALLCTACVTKPRLDGPPAASLSAAPPGFTTPVRVYALDQQFYETHASDSATRIAAAATDGSIDFLALSGGGAGGAYGAGILVGMSEAHVRPQFEVVTGVSTGALIAPVAFLGPEYDYLLSEGYATDASSDLMQSLGLGALFSVAIYQGRPLRDLVDRFITDDLIDAVGREAATGRLLLVATTNLDRQETVIWNMGAIAREGGASAHQLFRDVLVASASVPGVFPPVMIQVRDGEQTFQEMHVDGGSSIPFFIAPDIALTQEHAPEALRGANIYVIDNAQLSQPSRTTRYNTVSIANRAFNTVLMHNTRGALVQTDAFARRNDMTFRFSAIPRDYRYSGSLAFDQASMSALFDYGRRCASSGHIWLNVQTAMARAELAERSEGSAAAAPSCPIA